MRDSGVKNADGKYYGHQSRHACKGVYLPEAQINLDNPGAGAAKPLAITDPYCPAVRATTLNDTPFVVKRGKELPAVGEG